MAITGTYTRTMVVNGLTFGTLAQVTSDLAPPWSVTLAAAKTGTLTTRSSGTAGTLTMTGGHGITDGQRIDIYWSTGSCRGATVGTVSVNSVPFTGATGDALPVQDTAVTVQVPDEETFAVPGDDTVSISVSCPQGGTVVFADSMGAEIFAVVRDATTTNYVNVISETGTNPFAGETVAKIFLSQRSSSQTSTLTGCVQYD